METGRKPDIVIISDSDECQQMFDAWLRADGHRPKLTSTFPEGWQLLQSLPAILLLDICTNADDTVRFIRQIKTQDAAGAVRVILITDASDEDVRTKALTSGVDEFLCKPVNRSELLTRIRTSLKLSVQSQKTSTQIGINVESEVARRTQELTKAVEKIKIASLDTVYRLSRAAEYKDEHTGAHVQRMSHYSSAIARSMGLDSQFIENILWAAPMHDIGKIGVPDSILLKPGKLTEEEWVIMKRHTIIGSEILKDADTDFIMLAADIALTHHEKWSGEGYPHGIKQSEIPLAGRIVALADVFDALTSDRPYKAAFPMEKAMEIIKEGRGTHFDPEVANAFLKIEDEIRSELNWWKFMFTKTGSDGLNLEDLSA